MKELDQTVLRERLLASIKGHLCLTIQKHLDNPNWKLFLITLIYINNFFFKKGTFNEWSDLQMLYLSKIDAAKLNIVFKCLKLFFLRQMI